MTSTQNAEFRLDRRPGWLYPPKPHPTARSKAVTIAIGFCAEDGIVLAADREITSSLGTKYQQKKVFSILAHRWAIGISYAGYCDIFDCVHEKIKTELEPLTQQSPTFEILTGLIKDILGEEKKEHRNKMILSTLLAISIGPQVRLYKSEAATVSPAGGWKVLGMGDTPLTHYLVNTLMESSRDRFDQYEALLLAAYVVIQANKYTQGCNGGPDILIVQKHGTTERLRQEPPLSLQRSLASLTQEIAEMWGEMCEVGNNTETFLKGMSGLSKRLAKVREQLRSIPRIKIAGA